MRLILFAASSILLMSGCATTSFAPPRVSVKHVDTERMTARLCAASTSGDTIAHNVPGAQLLIDNFVDAYRCAAHSAADGRQWFELPSFLALTGSALAVAFGAGKDVAIAASGASSILNGGKAYYVPAQKAALLDHALDALLCIKTESVGVNAFAIGDVGDQQRTKLIMTRGSGASVTIPVDEMYFNLVAAALLSVERVMAQRLRDLGNPDAAGIVAQIKQNAQEIRDADDKRKAGKGMSFTPDGRMNATGATLELGVLQKTLQDCVVRAKV